MDVWKLTPCVPQDIGPMELLPKKKERKKENQKKDQKENQKERKEKTCVKKKNKAGYTVNK